MCVTYSFIMFCIGDYFVKKVKNVPFFLTCSFNSVENNDTKSYVAVILTYVLIKVLATSQMWLLTYKKNI